MSLRYKDLKSEEARLQQIIEHAEKELMAVQTLIQGRELRQETTVTVIQGLQGMTVKAAAKTVALEWQPRRFTAGEMTAELEKRGFQDEANLRANVGNALKDLTDKGFLERENIGDRLTKYEYWVKQSQ